MSDDEIYQFIMEDPQDFLADVQICLRNDQQDQECIVAEQQPEVVEEERKNPFQRTSLSYQDEIQPKKETEVDGTFAKKILALSSQKKKKIVKKEKKDRMRQKNSLKDRLNTNRMIPPCPLLYFLKESIENLKYSNPQADNCELFRKCIWIWGKMNPQGKQSFCQYFRNNREECQMQIKKFLEQNNFWFNRKKFVGGKKIGKIIRKF